MRLFPIIEPVSDLTMKCLIMSVSQLQRVGNKLLLLLLTQQSHFAFDLLEAHDWNVSGVSDSARSTTDPAAADNQIILIKN